MTGASPGRLRVALLAAWGLVACAPLDPAPQDLDGLLHFLWNEYDEGEPAELASAVVNLHALLDDSVEAGGVSGSVSLLTEDERRVAGVVVEGIPPEKEAGLYVADPLEGCSVDEVEEILAWLRQDLLYDQFESYSRTDTGDREAYFARQTDRLTWDVEYSVTIPLAGRYDARLSGGVRRIPQLSPSLTPFGPFVLSRSALTEPATFDGPDEVFDQDRRIQLLYAPADGRLTHVEALWRHMEAGAADTGEDVVRSLIVGGLREWEDETAAWCGRELP